MAQNGNSNAPFLDQNNYLAVTGTSNSPFTDQRAVAAGGGPGPGGSGGNVQFTDATGINGRLQVLNAAGTQALPIRQIIQQDSFIIGAPELDLFTNEGDMTLSTVDGSVQISAFGTNKVARLSGPNVICTGTDLNLVGISEASLTSVSGDVKIAAQSNTQVNLSDDGVELVSITPNVGFEESTSLCKVFKLADNSHGVQLQTFNSTAVERRETSEINLDNNGVDIFSTQQFRAQTQGRVFLSSLDELRLEHPNNQQLLDSTGMTFNTNGEFDVSADTGISLESDKISIEADDDFTIEAENDILLNTNSGNARVRLGSLEDTTTGEFQVRSYKNTSGTIFRWDNRDITTNDLIGSFEMFRGSGNEENLLCEGIDLFSFAGNDTQVGPAGIFPSIRFNQVDNTGCTLSFRNAPTATGDILTVAPLTGANDGSTANPFQLLWQQPAGGGGSGDVTYDPGTFNLNYNNAGVPTQIATIQQNNQNIAFRTASSSNTGTVSASLIANNTSSDAASVVVEASDPLQTSIRMSVTNTPTGTLPSSTSDVFLTGDQWGGSSLETFQLQNLPEGAPGANSSCLFSYGNSNTGNAEFYKWPNNPNVNVGQFITVVSGEGLTSNPYILNWQVPPSSQGSANSNLVLDYDKNLSVLTLSDPTDNLAVISQTAIVPGRTILIDTVLVQGQGTFSCFGLSNTVFPPPATTIAIGNNPPSVPLDADGNSLWSIGNTFRVTIGGKINDFDNNDNLVYQVLSNRGQTSQNVLNSFNLELSGVGVSSFGFTWSVVFTVRTLNDGAVLGTIATNSSFSYTDDQFKPETEGAIISNVNASFDTSIEQYLDCTLRFPSAGNSLSVNTAVIERIF